MTPIGGMRKAAVTKPVMHSAWPVGLEERKDGKGCGGREGIGIADETPPFADSPHPVIS